MKKILTIRPPYFVLAFAAGLFLLALALITAPDANAQTAAELPHHEDVQPLEPMAIDGVWRLKELGKQVVIDQGRVIAMDGWLHMFLWSVEPGMVTSTNLREDGPGQYTAYDNLLKAKTKWQLRSDGSIRAKSSGFFGATFHLEPVTPNYPDAFRDQVAAVGGGSYGPGGPAPNPSLAGNNGERPGPIDIPLDSTFQMAAAQIPGKCLKLYRSQMQKQGGTVGMWKCKGTDNEIYAYLDRDKLIVSGSGMCLEATGTVRGSAVKTYGCDGNAAQQWDIVETVIPAIGFGSIKSSEKKIYVFKHSSGKCLDASPQKKNGGAVVLYDCGASGRKQNWFLK